MEDGVVERSTLHTSASSWVEYTKRSQLYCVFRCGVHTRGGTCCLPGLVGGRTVRGGWLVGGAYSAPITVDVECTRRVNSAGARLVGGWQLAVQPY